MSTPIPLVVVRQPVFHKLSFENGSLELLNSPGRQYKPDPNAQPEFWTATHATPVVALLITGPFVKDGVATERTRIQIVQPTPEAFDIATRILEYGYLIPGSRGREVAVDVAEGIVLKAFSEQDGSVTTSLIVSHDTYGLVTLRTKAPDMSRAIRKVLGNG